MTARSSKPRIVIVGGGMAGLTTAFELSSGAWRDRYESIRLFQRGWRLGGKGASSRGKHSRIEEHGLHVLLGYYQDTFRVMEECYAELDRSVSAPDCPIPTWLDAVKPAATVGLTDFGGDAMWQAWTLDFPADDEVPGRRPSAERISLPRIVVQSLRLLAAYYSSQRPGGDVVISDSPQRPDSLSTAAAPVLRSLGLTALAGIVEAAGKTGAAVAAVAGADIGRALESGLAQLRSRLREVVAPADVDLRTWRLVDLVLTNLSGIVADRLLWRGDGLRAIDDLDYRDWLRRHGAAEDTIDCAIVRGMYDLVFAYRDGDPDRPGFAAGWGLELATSMLLDYDGSLFWKMQAGMGEVIFAPLYQVLRDRGVEFEFFHRLDRMAASAGRVTAVSMGRQATVVTEPYRPLVDVAGLPAWPAEPDLSQLADGGEWLSQSESFFGERHDSEPVELVADEDFDLVVFAASLGMVPHTCTDLMDQDPRWQAMVDHIGTVATQAFQIWLTADEAELGWSHPAAVTLSGFAPPFDTWAGMSHLLDVEQWPAAAGVNGIAYFCGSMADSGTTDAAAQVKQRAIDFLEKEVDALWPEAVDGSGFRWPLLADGVGAGPERFDSQYWRANVDPSDRYVQSLPGTDRYRLAPGDTGFANLVIAGDWTDCGLNAGCVEAATRSGILAAAAVAARAEDLYRGSNG